MLFRRSSAALLITVVTCQASTAAEPGRLGSLLQNLFSREQPSSPSDGNDANASLSPPAQSSPSVLARDSLPQHALDAGRDFRPKTAQDIEHATQQLRAAMLDLERFWKTDKLDPPTDWKTQLRWEEMTLQLTQEAGPVSRVLREILQRYRQNIPGIEHAPFTKVRDRLEVLVNTILYANTQITTVYRQRLKQLASKLAGYQENPTSDDGFLIGRIAGFLHQGGQADPLVASIHHHYSHPNLVLSVSQGLIKGLLSQQIEDTMPLEDRIMGTTIRGTVHTVGHVTVELVDSRSRADLRIRLQGSAKSKSIGTNRGVTVHTTGHTTIDASKLVYLDALGLHPQPAAASCETESSIDSVSARLRCIEKLAWRRVLATQPQGEQIASRQAEQRVAERVDQQTTEMLQDANTFFRDKFRQPLIRRNAFPRLLEFATSASHLKLTMLQSNARQIAAPGPPPKHDDAPDVGIQLHESLVGNLSEAVLGGEMLTGERLAKLLEDLGAEVPAELQGGAGEPWSITFSSNRPIRMTFQDNLASISIRGRRFTRGDTVVSNVIDITARYKLEMTPAGLQLTRHGEVEVVYVNRKSLGVPQIAIKTMLLKKFNSLYKSNLQVQQIVLPERWQQAGNLKIKNSSAMAGWLILSWAMDPSQPASPKVAHEP